MKKNRAKFKFNGGNPVLLCNKCAKIIKYRKDFTEEERAACDSKKYLKPQYCKSCGLEEKVYNYPTKYEEGFLGKEYMQLASEFTNINMDKFEDALKGITCMMKEDGIIIYHCDILKALRCGLENRDLTYWEWD